LEDLKTIQRIEQEIDATLVDLGNNQYHKALAHTEIALKYSPDADSIKLLKAKALLGLKKPQDVVNLVTEIMRNDPNNSEALYVRGVALFYTGNAQAAIKHFRQALQGDPDNPKYRNHMKKAQQLETRKKDGNDAFSAGKNQEAYDIYTECLSIDVDNVSTNATLYCNRAAAAMKLKKYQEAVDDCNKALEMDSQYVKAYARRAACYTQLEMHDEAVRDFEKLRQMDPENDEHSRNLREAKLNQKKAARKDYYKILGVGKDADENQIKKAYKKNALQWHPDKNSESEDSKKKAESMFKELGEAYAVLSDPQKKRRYDLGEDLEMDPGVGDVDVSQIFSMFFGGGRGPMGFGGGFNNTGGMGGGFGGQQPRSRRYSSGFNM